MNTTKEIVVYLMTGMLANPTVEITHMNSKAAITLAIDIANKIEDKFSEGKPWGKQNE